MTIVSSNRETLRALENYFKDVGVSSNGTRSLERMVDMTPPSSTAVVVFPDEYAPGVVEKSLSALHHDRPELLLVIVTNEPQRFDRMVHRASAGAAPLVIPKPAWAWTILDAIRARLDQEPAHG